MRRIVASLLFLGLVLPAAGGARLAGKSWATGVITKVGAGSISIRGTISLVVSNGANGTKTTLDGTRLLSCDVRKVALVHGFRAGGRARITCVNGTLSQIIHG